MGDALRSILGLKSTLFDFYVNHNPAKARVRLIIALLARMILFILKATVGVMALVCLNGRCGNGKAR